jgi:hypothetical protein
VVKAEKKDHPDTLSAHTILSTHTPPTTFSLDVHAIIHAIRLATCLLSSIPIHIPVTMLRQAISTSSRVLRAAPRVSQTQPLLRNQFQTAPAFSIRAAARPVAGRRWYSETKETKEGEESAAAKEDGEADPLAELKKNLEAKDEEARDWKVRLLSLFL